MSNFIERSRGVLTRARSRILELFPFSEPILGNQSQLLDFLQKWERSCSLSSKFRWFHFLVYERLKSIFLFLVEGFKIDKPVSLSSLRWEINLYFEAEITSPSDSTVLKSFANEFYYDSVVNKTDDYSLGRNSGHIIVLIIQFLFPNFYLFSFFQ